MDSQDHGDDKVKQQSITISSIIGKAIEAIVAYIAIYFFKPVWQNIVQWWKGNNESNN